MEYELTKIKDLKNPPKDFIFDKNGPQMIAVPVGEILQLGDKYQVGNNTKWNKTSLVGQVNVSPNYYFRMKKRN